MPEHDVLIVGGGLAGLACALELSRQGASPLILEAGDGVGGRVRTDEVDGFLLDRGFQVILEAYPECRRVLDYDALELRAFFPGAEIWTGQGLVRFSDPFRRPQDAMATLRASVGTVGDKLTVAKLRREVMKEIPDALLRGPERSAREDLEGLGFSEGMIRGFLGPFFGGVLLNPALTDSSRIFRYLFRMFSEGNISVPRKGMEEIPRQLLRGLPEGSVRLGARVESVNPGQVTLQTGETLRAEAVVVATEAPEASRLIHGLSRPESRATVCLYFEAAEPPLSDPILVLNGTGEGPVNNLAVLSRVSEDYAPPGRHLVSVTVLGLPQEGEGELETAVRDQIGGWFGSAVEGWRHVRSYRIPHALPAQEPGRLNPPERSVKVVPGLFVCGDHRETASLQGALHSGRRAAEAVLDGSSASA